GLAVPPGMCRYDGTAVTPFSSMPVGDEITGRNPSDAYATGGNNNVWHWNGTTWTDDGVSIMQPSALAVTATDVIAAEGVVAATDAIYVKAAGTWQNAFTANVQRTGACAAPNGDVIVVGRFGQAAVRDMGAWALNAPPTARFLLGCAYAANAHAWAVGGDAVEHYVAGAWTDLTTFPTKHTLDSIAAVLTPTPRFYVTGNAGIVIAGDGTTWAEEATPTGYDLQKVTVSPTGTVFV